MDLLEKYQNFVRTTESSSVKSWDHNKRLLYFALGLCGEAGEAAEKIKKLVRDNNGQIRDHATLVALVRELGDPLWYLAQLCDEVSEGCFSSSAFGLGHLMEENMNKLNDRLQRGTIQGSGDDR